MRNIKLVIVLLLIVSFGSAKNNENKQPEPNTLTAKEKQNGWQLLFDGKTTHGWKSADSNDFPAEGWKVVDGTLTSIANSPDAPVKGIDIITTDKYSAFDLQFEFNFTEGANSGVKYFIGNGGPSIGLEYQILDDQRNPDAKLGVVGNRCLAALYDLIPINNQGFIAKSAGEWNTGRIVVYPDNRIEHWLNGKKVLEYVRGSGIYKALVARSKYAGYEGFGMVKETPILLQYHGDQVRFRSLKIKKL